MKVVVIVKNGVVTQVLTDSTDVRVIVLDSDTEHCDDDTRMDVVGEDVALDAMLQGVAKHEPAEVADIFADVLAELQQRDNNETTAELVTALFTH